MALVECVVSSGTDNLSLIVFMSVGEIFLEEFLISNLFCLKGK